MNAQPTGSRAARLRITGLAALIAGAVAVTSPVAHSEDPALAPAPERVYVIVVDGLMPKDVTAEQMPNLAALKAQSTWYEEARSVFVTETLPNHAAMMSGVTPARSGIVGNKYLRPGGGAAGGEYPIPATWRSDTLVTRLERACGQGVNTATILSKSYLFNAFTGEPEGDPNRQLEADYHPVPEPFVPVSDHAPDAVMMNFLTPWATNTPTPQFAFVNLGDVDRAGHADDGGNTVTEHSDEFADNPQADENAERANEFQQSAMVDTDTLLNEFFGLLKDEGWWDDSVIVLLSDHGMNWARQEHWIDTVDELQNTARLSGGNVPNPNLTGAPPRYTHGASGDFVVVNNGAADQIYLLEQNQAERRNMVTAIRNLEGVERVFADPDDFSATGDAPQHPRADYGLEDERAGDLIAFAKPGYSFNPGGRDTNPVPGVHGHAVTQHNTLMVTGGHPSLAAPGSVPGADLWPVREGRAPLPPHAGAGVMSVAPTIAALTGLGEIPGGYDGRQLSEAFDPGTLGGSEPFCGGLDPVPPADTGGETEEPPVEQGTPPAENARVSEPVARGSAATSLTTSTRTASYRRPFTLSGRVGSSGCSQPDWVVVRRRRAGQREFVDWAELPVSRTGTWKTEVSAERNASYLAVPEGTKCASVAPSDSVTVSVRPQIRLTRIRACARGGQVAGTARPGGRGKSVLLQRRAGSNWRTIARDKLDRKSRFSLTPRRCGLGRHRVVWPRQGGGNIEGRRAFRR